MDSHKTHKTFVQMAKQLEQAAMSAVVHLVHVRFPLETYVKDISRSTNKNSNRVIDFVS